MKEFNEAATLQMELDTRKALYDKLPEIAAAIGAGYNGANINVIGNDSGVLAGNIMSLLTQVIQGLDGVGVDGSSVVSGFIGGKVAQKRPAPQETQEE